MRRLFLVLLIFWLSAAGWCEGKVALQFEKATDPNLDRLRLHLEKQPYLAAVPRALEQFLEMPRPLKVLFSEAGGATASYSPADHSVTVGYEIYATLVNTFIQAGHSPGKAVQLADAALVHILLHQLGHAVIGELELPVTGDEEDCADEFAILLSSNALGSVGRKMALASVEFFGILGGDAQVEKLPFWDEHSLNRRRYLTILGELNAAFPQGVPGVEEELSGARLAQAKREYPRKVVAWMRQLSPHLVAGASLKRLKSPPDIEGHLKAALGAGNSEMTRSLAERFAAGGTHQAMVKDFDTMFLWPRDLTVLFTDTGEARCRFHPDRAELVISLDFFERVAPAGEARLLEGLVGFTVLREIGEALLSELDLPLTGEPQEVSAEFTMILLSAHPRGQDWATQTARVYQRLEERKASPEDLGLLDRRQFEEILGYLYGQDPVAFAFVERMMPEGRLVRYQRDFVQKSLRWETLLKPYAQHLRLGN